MKNTDTINHVRGESIYMDDIVIRQGTLYGLVYDAPYAHAKIINLDIEEALSSVGVHTILTHKDIPGENQIGGIIPDEPLFADQLIHFWGMPVALIVAESEYLARKARDLIKIEVEELPVIVDPREAFEKGEHIVPPRTFAIGNVDTVWDQCDFVFEGRADTNGQEHLYIETQGAYAFPNENGSIRISSSTQGPTAVQRTAAKVLGVPMHKVEVDVTRLGGGFGGKEDQASVWGTMAALATYITDRPVKIAVHRMDDMRMTGKRHPYSSDFKIGLTNELKILAYQADFYQNSGAACDLSPAVLERTLFHATNSYYVPNVKTTATCCRTNLPPNTAFRGFGGPQGMFVMESAIQLAATKMGVKPREIQEKNLLKDGEEWSYGQVVDQCEAQHAWLDAMNNFDIVSKEKDIANFNNQNSQYKKGMAIMPICFGISFTNTPMNQARALVHVYQDGSVGISTGGVEMGQGLNMKMIQVAMDVFGIDGNRIKIESTNTTRVANTSPSAASATSDLNGKALQKACGAILNRLKESAADQIATSIDSIQIENEKILVDQVKSDMTWTQLVNKAFLDRKCLTENGHYATPVIHFDKSTNKGHPFAYHVYGTAITEVTLDCLRGRYEIDSVDVVHDFGKSMNPAIDLGQLEGGIVQGLGWMTMEELVYNEKGKLLSNALSTYKIPDIYSVPKAINYKPLDTQGHDMAIKKSKAVGEPPLMYGIGVFFALQNAIRAFNMDYKMEFDAPLTPEKVLMALYSNREKQILKNVLDADKVSK